MKITQLPEPVRSKALEYQRNAGKECEKDTDNLLIAFRWECTEEKGYYWECWSNATEVTPELLKMHYKDAKEVRCLFDSEVLDVSSFKEYRNFHEDICIGIEGFDYGDSDDMDNYLCLYRAKKTN